ncbi:hypothetical protein [Xylanimonas sp. McL0601]|uniref:hypothetical protein n=1 Tax=Xylanimonas sp. McL0601 TaxID=3414739 RepID=UPI003CEE6E1A
MTSPDDDVELRREVDQLRARVAELQESPAAARHTGAWWRIPVCVLLIVLVFLLAPATLIARWAHGEVSDTQRFTQLVAPLASDPAVQTAVTDRVTGEILDRLDIPTLVNQAADALTQQGLGPVATRGVQSLVVPLSDALEGFVRGQVQRVVASDAFATVFEQAVRTAHRQAVAVLTGEGSDAVDVQGGAVSLNLAPVIARVKEVLVDRGFTVAARIPEVDVSFTIFSSAGIVKAQGAFDLLSKSAVVLPLIVVVLLAGAVAVARDHRRMLVVGLLAVAAGMVVLGLALAIARSFYLGAIPRDMSTAAAASVYDAVAGSIRPILRGVLVLALLAALGVWLTGKSAAARQTRKAGGAAVGWLRSQRARGVSTGPVGTALWTARVPIRIAIVAVAALVMVTGNPITPGRVVTTAIWAAVIWVVFEILASPPDSGVESALPPEPAAHGTGPDA